MSLTASRRRAALVLLALTMAVLIPGLVLPVITIRGVIEPAGLGRIAPQLLETGVSPESVEALKPLINPAMLPFLEMTPGGLRGAIVGRLSDQIATALAGGQEIEVYQQTRSILGAVRHLYSVNSHTAATLILLFSVIVPVGKAGLVLIALSVHDARWRRTTLRFVELIAKWSMADVFAVALFITYLAAQASQAGPGSTSAVSFSAAFGPGFYWFSTYCVVSLAVQQVTTRVLAKDADGPGSGT